MQNVSWTALRGLKGNATALKKIDDAEQLLKSLREALRD
jgi:hypothetical protein